MNDLAAEPTPSPRLSATVRGALWMVGGCAAFTGLMAIVRHVSAELHPIEVAFFRNLFGLAFMLPWAFHVGIEGLRTERFGLHLVRAVSGIAAMSCFFLAIAAMPLAEVTALVFTVPLFVTVGAALFLGERVRLRRWSAVGVGFLGMLVILRPGIEALTPAAGLATAAAALIAASLLLIKKLSATEQPNAIVVWMGILMTPLSLIPAAFVWTWPEPMTWVLLVGAGLFATLGQIGLTRAFALADTSAMMPFDFSRLVFAAVLGYVLFGEWPDVWTWVGGAIIVGAVVYIARREAQVGAEKPPAPPA